MHFDEYNHRILLFRPPPSIYGAKGLGGGSLKRGGPAGRGGFRGSGSTTRLSGAVRSGDGNSLRRSNVGTNAKTDNANMKKSGSQPNLDKNQHRRTNSVGSRSNKNKAGESLAAASDGYASAAGGDSASGVLEDKVSLHGLGNLRLYLF